MCIIEETTSSIIFFVNALSDSIDFVLSFSVGLLIIEVEEIFTDGIEIIEVDATLFSSLVAVVKVLGTVISSSIFLDDSSKNLNLDS